MAQKTNLNVSPYFDDFDADKNFYKVLFNPGRPIQSRELNTIQSILQNQIESFGSHIFKEGSLVIPGGVTYENRFHAVKLNPTTFNIDISVYIEQFIGKTIIGQSSGIKATIQYISFPDNGNVEYITLYVKYLESGDDFSTSVFINGESLICTENVTYGNTVINARTVFASLISDNATALGSSVSISNGVYFVRGCFVKVLNQTIILDNYTNYPSYRVGLKIIEEIISAKDDKTLYDNAKGFNNYAAPGADRFAIILELTKKPLSDYSTDTDFVELLRVRSGNIEKLETKTEYNLIKDYIAQRTFEESGNYTVEPFTLSVNNSLNNRLGNDGLFFSGEKTNENNDPTDDLMCVKVSPGKAYVIGHDVMKSGTSIIDVVKPRDTEKVLGFGVPFNMGNIIRVNNISGCAVQNQTIDLYDRRVGDSGVKIGDARVYSFNLTDAAYVGGTTNWDLYLYDIQTYTEITLNSAVSNSELPATSYVVGKSSGASGYAVSAGGGSTRIKLRQTSGSFSINEQLIINGVESYVRSVQSIKVYSAKDIKSVYQSGSPTFTADTVLNKSIPNGFSLNNQITVSVGGTITSPNKLFSGISTNSIIRYGVTGFSTETYNRVASVSADGLSMNVVAIPTVLGVCVGSLPSTETKSSLFMADSAILKQEDAYLYTELPNPNVATVDLSNSNISFSAESNISTTVSGNTLTVSASNFNLPAGISQASFQAYDEQRYSIHYTDGTIETLTGNEVVISSNQVTFSGISNKTIHKIKATFIKSGIQSKVKTFNRSNKLVVNLSKYNSSGSGISSSINDGLVYNQYYGLRVQDEEICLNYPDVSSVLVVYESLDVDVPQLDQLSFSSIVNVASNSIIGENIIGRTSNTLARIVAKPGASPNNLEIVYLNSNRFFANEEVLFEESNIIAEIDMIISGKYKDITNNFKLDRGQRDQYYDYSRLIRNRGESEPARELLVVFDHYVVSATDNGDAFTVLSYQKDRFARDIPYIGLRQVRATDTLDFRPRVANFSGSSSSPFDFSSRSLSISTIFKPNESSLVSYDYYLGRTDKLYLDKYGALVVQKGISSRNPKEPLINQQVLELATIYLPPYLYSPKDAKISLIDNRRYTMKDIGKIEDRVENLEKVTSLSLLELNTQSLQIQDADGFNRFKTGFFVDDFKTTNLIDLNASLCEVNDRTNQLTPIISRNTLQSQLVPAASLSVGSLDRQSNYQLLDNRVQKTGPVVTLAYVETDWIQQPFATLVENVNPFNVINYNGLVTLTPARDTWIRTIQLDNKVLTHSNTLNLQITTETNRFNLNNVDNRSSAGTGLSGRTVTVADTFTSLSSNTTSQTANTRSSDSSTSQTEETAFVTQSNEIYIRSRNTQFVASNLKAGQRFYQFFDNNSKVDFIPKLIEISQEIELINPGSSGASFIIGERVIVYNAARLIASFRVAQPNHKFGPFDAPTITYDINPYSKEESLPTNYSTSTPILNIDTFSLADETDPRYFGYLVPVSVIIGTTSGAIAYVKDLRLISDNAGDLIGSFFLRDPNTNPPPTVRITTGNKTFKLTSSPTDEPQLLGSTDISSAQANYLSEGTTQMYQDIARRNIITANLDHTQIVNTTTLTETTQTAVSQFELPPEELNFITNITQDITNVTNVTEVTNVTNIIQQQAQRHNDPLAQTFTVGVSLDAIANQSFTEDVNGVYVTSVDLYFRSKSTNNKSITVQIRTVELGTPTLMAVGGVVLSPSQINISEDASVPTRCTFPNPLFLPPGNEYALVLLAPESNEYEVWIAEMGQKTINTSELPDAESVRYTAQFAVGSLFKSQNGSIWTANQYQDLKFKLYKAAFTQSSGTVFFQNPDLGRGNNYIKRLFANPLTTYPRKLKVGITTTYNSNLISQLTTGRKVSENLKTYNYGYVVGTGSSVSSLSLTTGGKGYVTDTLVSTYNITGQGSGLTLNISASSGVITGTPTIVSSGNGYAVGDIVGILTSTVSSNTGEGAQITITGNSSSIDTLYLNNVQGNQFGDGSFLSYFDNSGNRVTLGSTYIRGNSVPYGSNYGGNYIKVNHFNHGMYANNNRVTISDARSNVAPVSLISDLASSDVLINVSIADTANFRIFEGIPVSAVNPGYLQINNEIIEYTSVGVGIIENLTRGVDSTIPINHITNDLIYKYEVNGVSLRRINTTHDISDYGLDIDSYHIEVSLNGNDVDGGVATLGPDRSVDGLIDGSGADAPRLGFNLESTCGGTSTFASENIIFNSVIPMYQIFAPSGTTGVSAQIRTVSGTSASGTETSFIDQGYEDVELNAENVLNSSRIVCSTVNENEFLSSMPRNKSFLTAITLTTNNWNVSPMIFLDTTFTEFISGRLNQPISNYATDKRSNSLTDDPHAAIYVSNTIRLSQQSNTLKVFVAAYRHSSADFRVLYSLIRPDSSEIEQAYELFPGYDNLTIDNNQDGYLDVVDPSRNSGLPDIAVPSSLQNQFLEYQYTASNIGPFTGYKIKIVMSGTDQARYPRLKDVRTIALA